jgi:zinc transport system substrate-binding protein
VRHLLPALLLLPWVASACAPSSPHNARPLIGVAFYPIEEIVRAVGGDAVDVVTVVPPGEEAHEYEPTPKQVTKLDRADIVFYLGGGFQPGVEQALAVLPGRVVQIDLLAHLPLLHLGDGTDPHVWLAPGLMAQMADQVRGELAAIVPASAAEFGRRAAAYTAALTTLDGEMSAGLAECRSRLLVTGHEAFGYLAAAYGLRQEAIAGISPGEEPSAKALERIAELVRREGVTTVFFESGLPGDLSRTLAAETGAATAELYTVESPSRDELAAGDDYASQMRLDLAALRKGLGCT